jgi:tripartite-type tricarboxylate transporter receptor subunit TctC
VSSAGQAMKLRRRQFLHLAAGAVALPAVSRIARAQTYPAKPVRIIVGFAAGGSYDIIARLMGQRLSERLAQQFIMENRTGANGNIATEAVVRAAPDGYTLLLAGDTNAVNATVYEKLNFNFLSDIAPVAAIARVPNVMAVHPSLPAKTVPEFVAYARANPGKINMGSGGIGSPGHMSGELFKMMTGINLVHVPYRGGAPAVTDLLAGQVQVMFGTLPQSLEYVRTGKVRGLAVTTAARSPALPDLPPISDSVPGYDTSGWTGIGVPRNTPAQIINRLNTEINVVLADRTIVTRFADLGLTPLAGSPADFGKLVANDTEKWRKVVKFVGIKAE